MYNQQNFLHSSNSSSDQNPVASENTQICIPRHDIPNKAVIETFRQDTPSDTMPLAILAVYLVYATFRIERLRAAKTSHIPYCDTNFYFSLSKHSK